MSVPVPKRHSGELEVNVCTRELCLYTLRILSNEKIFPASQAYIIQEIRETVLDIHTTCWEANNIKVLKGNSFHLIQRMDKFYNDLWEGSQNESDQSTADNC